MEIKEETRVYRFIEFDGIRWYPDKRGYWMAHPKGKKSPMRLHQYVWEYYNGPIPDGYHVHHKDFNPDNNEIENLELITKHEHLCYHSSLQDKVWARNNLLTKAVPAAKEWHASEAGREWHSEHGKQVWEANKDKKVTKVCQFCGKEYEVVEMYSEGSRFCSNNCKAAWRRQSGLDNVQYPCEKCGKPIWTNKYAPKRFCSDECRHARQLEIIATREGNRRRRKSLQNIVADV